jgi:hypothetical protein
MNTKKRRHRKKPHQANVHEVLIHQLGGCSQLAEWLKVNRATVWRWQDIGIPAEYWKPILRMCRRQGIAMSADKLRWSAPEPGYRHRRIMTDWTQERIEQLIELYHAGLSDDEIAEKMQLNWLAIANKGQRLGLRGNFEARYRHRRKMIAWTQKRTDRLIELHHAGLCDAAIAEEMQLSPYKISGKRRRLGLRCNPGRRPWHRDTSTGNKFYSK